FAALILTLSILVPSFVEVGSSVWTANSAVAAESSANLADKKWIDSLDIETQQNGKWVAVDGSTPLSDGSNVRAKLAYTIPMGSLTGKGSKVTYQFPDGFKIDKEQKGNVYSKTDSSKVIGTYTISTDGKVEITFNENFDPKTKQTGTLTVNGTLENTSSSDEKKLNFPGSGTTIVIKKKDNGDTDHDIQVEKKGTVAEDKKSVSYTVKVSTTKGTPDTVDVDDTLHDLKNVTGSYDRSSFKIVKVDAIGNKTELSTSKYQPVISTNSSNQATFKISSLPKLDKGESYEITYSVKISTNLKDNTEGYEEINNSIHAKSKDKDSWNGDRETIHNSRIQKDGSYKNGEINWRINVNNAEEDISHYVLYDNLPDNSSLLDDIQIVDDSTGEKYDLSPLIRRGKKGDKSIYIDFSRLPDKYKKDRFTITYRTKAPETDDKSVKVENKADFYDTNHHYSSDKSVDVPAESYGVHKQFDSEEAISGNSDEKKYNWTSTYTLSGKIAKYVDLSDIFEDATSVSVHDQSQKPHTDTHYGIASELYKELTDPNKQELIAEEGSKTTKYILGQDYKVDLHFYKYVVKKVNGEDQGSYEEVDHTDSKTHIKYYSMRILPLDGKTIKPTKFVIHYSSRANISKVSYGETWTYKNYADFVAFNGTSINQGDIAQHEYKKDANLVKDASLTGVADSYKGEDLNADLDKTNGEIYYRILVKLPKGYTGKAEVTDLLPKGMTYVDGSLKAKVYYSDWDTRSQITWWDNDKHANLTYDLDGAQKPSVSTQKQADGTTKLMVSVPDGYDNSNSNIIQLTYKASVKGDDDWEDMSKLSKSYTNTVSWNGYTDKQTTNETREVSVLKKKGVQIKDADGNPTNVIGYQVDINPQSLDLNPDGDTVILNDQLSLSSGMDAYLDLQKTKLYKYDYKAENHIGDEIDHSLYSLKYDSDTHQIKLELPDKTACVLVYQYSIDTDNNINPTISNKASLAGKYSSDESTQLTDSSSSADITEQKISVYKVDSDDYTKNLPGAEFSLEKLNGSSWQKVAAKDVNVNGKLVTDQKGKLDLTNLSNNTVYRLKESKAPSGYSLNTKYFYLVWLNGKKTSDDVYKNLSDTVKNEIGKQSNIHFFKTAGGAIYVPDDYSQLTVAKHWVNSDGTAAKPGASSVKVDLYRVTKKLNSINVRVIIANPNFGNNDHSNDPNNKPFFDKTYSIEKGSTITIHGADNDGNAVKLQWILFNRMVSYTDNIQPNLDPNATSYTSPQLNSDTTIFAKESSNCWTTNVLVDKEDPQPIIDQTTKTKVETVTLDAANNWQKTWSDLPHEDENGNTYYYYVEEESVPGYKTSYRNNNGIKYGQIDVINQEKNEFYHLPQSGGRGLYAFLVLGTAIVASGLAFRRKKFN
ncbi:SpaA isopeptide-forming pilin-related protein, partial [Lactobacillus sp.]|uniref:SpaA isopeptide-forming pilin-related protein n=1 Tax=Lactobacillus sp. TaxID=1591 RepID=UPI003EFB2E6E